jgi:hypothetical protein
MTAMRQIGIGAIVVLSTALAAAAAWAIGVNANPADRPGADDSRTSRVEIYPTADRLPANTLRLYLVFDRPMSAGESRTRLKLIDADGRQVEGAFLHLEEELWDATGRRLTVLFDPGRIKRGLKAHLESGAPLIEGRRYRVVIDRRWRDRRGRPLGSDTVKPFEVLAADRTSPIVDEWKLEAPSPDTDAPLVVRFPEVLDRALLSSAIDVVDQTGASVPGQIDVAVGERRWSFTPIRPWQRGRYGLRVSTDLEDVAGNSLRRIFDAEVAEEQSGSVGSPPSIRRSFEIAR